MRTIVSIIVMFGLVAVGSGLVEAKGKKDPQVEEAPPPPATPLNACGCYRDDQGGCHCNKAKKLKCECEDDCEPAGCEEVRQQRADKEAAEALKKIQERDKKAQAAAKAAQDKRAKEKAEEAKKKAESGSRWK